MGEPTETTDPQASSTQKSAQEVFAPYGKVEHQIAGRTRLRVKAELRNAESMAQIKESLDSHPDVHKVTINHLTGSVVIEHDKKRKSHHIFWDVVGEAELVAGAVFELPEEEGEGEGESGGRFGKLDQQLANLIYRVDYHIWKKTGLYFRGQVVAGTVAAAGIAQILAFGISLETLPGPILLWIAWDIYHRVAKEPLYEDGDAAIAQAASPEAPVLAEAPAAA